MWEPANIYFIYNCPVWKLLRALIGVGIKCLHCGELNKKKYNSKIKVEKMHHQWARTGILPEAQIDEDGHGDSSEIDFQRWLDLPS